MMKIPTRVEKLEKNLNLKLFSTSLTAYDALEICQIDTMRGQRRSIQCYRALPLDRIIFETMQITKIRTKFVEYQDFFRPKKEK